jgi:transposase
MGNVLKMDHRQIIQGLIRLGWTNRAIHRETGFHRDTISRYRKGFENVEQTPTDSIIENRPKVPTDFQVDLFQNRPKVPADSIQLPTTKSAQIVSFIEIISKKFLQGFTAQRIYQDLVDDHGFCGSYDSVKRYARKLRKRVPKHYDHLRTPPGKEVQVDFSKACPVLKNGTYRKCWLFKMTLTFSGHSYEELVWKQDIETFIRCHEKAFRSFGGVPQTIKLDNLKSGVLQAHLYEPELNQVYLSFSKHWSFIPNPCAPYKPEHKGKVERDIGYTKSNALKGRKFDSLEEGNALLRNWNKRWARTRIHGTTRTQVWKLFIDTEKPVLKPLAEQSFSIFKISQRKVDVYGHIEVATNFYSVPHKYIGQRLRVHYNNTFVKVYDSNNTLIASHRSNVGKGKCITQPGHKPSYKPETLEMAEAWLCRDAKIVGPDCHTLVYKILSGYDPLSVRRCRGIISLKKKYSSDILNNACRQALYEQGYSYGRVKSLCEYFSSPGKAVKKITQEHELIRSINEYQNIIHERSC